MNKTLAAISVLIVAALAIASMGSCNMVKNIPGAIAGQVMDAAGNGRGYVAVQLIDVETNQPLFVENANDAGNYMFQGVDPGKYILRVMTVGGGELPTDAKEFTLSPGKTVTVNLVIQEQDQS
ncbi:carboxypeptidase regulatory-like domain-containing protein [bacterium]|nr:carboxypeptidase regulatory-like domain-containing protein [bacterium]